MIKKIGVLTGGGDCPGLNPAIKWIVKTALHDKNFEKRSYNFEVYGIMEGWRGLVKYNNEPVPAYGSARKSYVYKLTEKDVRTWDRSGGTNLGSSRTNPFNPKMFTANLVMSNIKALGLDALIAIGGEDTQSVAYRLYADYKFPAIGIPKTIDKDLIGTDYSLGFETAVQIITSEIDSIRTTAESHSRTFIVETMGRHAGHLAFQGGIAAGADVILLPEYPFEIEKVAEIIKKRKEKGHRYSIIVIAEGAHIKGEKPSKMDGKIDSGFGHVYLGGVGFKLQGRLANLLPDMEFRSVVLSHLQRGGLPVAYDRLMGRLFGIAAVNLLEKKLYGKMVSYKNGHIGYVPLPYQREEYELVDIDRWYDTNTYKAITSHFV